MSLRRCALHVQKAHICWPRPVSPPVPKARGPRRGVEAARTVQRTVSPALEPISAESARHHQTFLSSSTKAGATPGALRASTQQTAHVSPAALLAEPVKEMPPTATLAKEASPCTREHAGKPAPRGTWPWRGCARLALRCVRTASMRRRAKSVCLSPSCTRICVISPVPAASTRTHASASPATKTVWSVVAPRRMTVTSVPRHPWFSTMGGVWMSVQWEPTMRKRPRTAEIVTSPARPAHPPGPV